MSRFSITLDGIQHAHNIQATSGVYAMTEDEINAVDSWVRRRYGYDPDTCCFNSGDQPALSEAKRMLEAGVRACVHD